MTSARCSALELRRSLLLGGDGSLGHAIFHPLLCYLAETGEPLAGLLRPGNAAAHTAADHFEVLQLALEQLPARDLDREILVRADIGGRTHAFTSDCRSAGIRFSVGYEVDERVRGAIAELPGSAWQEAIDGDGNKREGALAQALLRWAALLCLQGELSLAEPKRVRQRLFHVAGRLVRSARRVALRLARSWPWAEALAAAFARLRALPSASP